MPFYAADIYTALSGEGRDTTDDEQVAISLGIQFSQQGVDQDADALFIASPVSRTVKYKGLVETTTTIYVALIRGHWSDEGSLLPSVCFGGSVAMQRYMSDYFPGEAHLANFLTLFAVAALPLLNSDQTFVQSLRHATIERWRSFRAPQLAETNRWARVQPSRN